MIALCSAFKKGLIALKIKEKIDYSELDANCGHSEKMLPAINDMLEKNGLKLNDNDTFAVVVGPGSFTGLRISLGLVKGLCCGFKNFNVIKITSFELMAYTYIKKFKPDSDFYCVINALSGNIFVAKFDKNGKQLTEEGIENIEFLHTNNVFVGLEEEKLTKIQIELNSADLLEVAMIKNSEENYVNIKNLQPLYLRKSQAEDDVEKKEKNLKKI